MKITITGRKVSLRDNFKERVEKKLKKFSRMFGEDASDRRGDDSHRRRYGVPLRANRSGNERRSG